VRSTVGKALGLRHSPTIAFVHDDVQEHVKHIDDLLAEARTADVEVQRLAAGAEYAGEAHPYKEDEEGADEDEADGAAGDARDRP
jgi:ribosome-binding factor A